MELKDTDVVVLWGLACLCGMMGTEAIMNKQVPSLAFTSDNRATFLHSINVTITNIGLLPRQPFIASFCLN